jgi:hypothetical protein
LSLNGGGGANSITIVGTTGNDLVAATASALTVSGGSFSNVPITVSNLQALRLPGGSGGSDIIAIDAGTWQVDADTPTAVNQTPNVIVQVSTGATANFTGDQRLDGLIVSGGSAKMLTGGVRKTLFATTVVIDGYGLLDLGGSDLLTNTAAATIRNYLQSARGPSANWSGPSGITSSAASANPTVNTVAYAVGSDPSAQGGRVKTADGQLLAAGMVLVRPTLAGDANLDGVVNFYDQVQVLGFKYNVAGTTASYTDGDLNFDGKVNFFDLSMILAGNFNTGTSFRAA